MRCFYYKKCGIWIYNLNYSCWWIKNFPWPEERMSLVPRWWERQLQSADKCSFHDAILTMSHVAHIAVGKLNKFENKPLLLPFYIFHSHCTFDTKYIRYFFKTHLIYIPSVFLFHLSISLWEIWICSLTRTHFSFILVHSRALYNQWPLRSRVTEVSDLGVVTWP